ncbi:arylsulfatase [Halieaceae bacterium IMCC14734]|uniref:Arylsulfatase n=2 Tax=Candidatus Litorirhabdus singularis TaxID=2518993 RepID=A0ABT3TKS5_9GAMM|nr:arylsulfatase [Candidatus Litorirhabdus singularis]
MAGAVLAGALAAGFTATAASALQSENGQSIGGSAPVPVNRPNIVLILADDLGFTDIAPYGSEINTPTLSAMAQRGMSFTNYHTAANCAPARAMLLTGVDAHVAGVPNIPEMLGPEQRRHDHYQGVLGNNVVTVATLLEDAGYHTYMAGKWHLGAGAGKLPSQRGFERTVALADSGADNWEQRPYIPIYDKANWYADGKEYELPEDFYSSRFLVDKTIEFIDSNVSNQRPFFAYLPFQAVHIPVQAPQHFIDPYMATYEGGWDELREQRLARAIALGIVPERTGTVRMQTTDDWELLDEERRRYEAKRMAVYAGMVEAMDFHIGRLIEYLKASGQYDNTIFIFTSDNGAEASGPADLQDFATQRMVSSLGYRTDYETLGLKGSYNAISPSFASAAASPLAYYKFYAGEGGMRVPLIIAGASLPAKGVLSSAFSFVTDITPTILSFAGVTPPGERHGGRPVEPMIGRSLAPLLLDNAAGVYGPEDAVGYELAGHAALFQGDYKIVFNRGPLGDDRWHLFNIVEDPGESHELSSEMPQRFQSMLSAYERYAKDSRVVPVPPGYDHRKQLVLNILYGGLRTPFVVACLSVLMLLPFYVAYRMRRRDMRRPTTL